MIKITDGIIAPPDEETGTPEFLTVFITVDGTDWAVGGLNPSWTRKEIQAHLDGREVEIKANIAAHFSVYPIRRPDLKHQP